MHTFRYQYDWDFQLTTGRRLWYSCTLILTNRTRIPGYDAYGCSSASLQLRSTPLPLGWQPSLSDLHSPEIPSRYGEVLKYQLKLTPLRQLHFHSLRHYSRSQVIPFARRRFQPSKCRRVASKYGRKHATRKKGHGSYVERADRPVLQVFFKTVNSNYLFVSLYMIPSSYAI